MDGDIFENAPFGTRICFIRIKKGAFSIISRYVWTGPDFAKRHLVAYQIGKQSYLQSIMLSRRFFCFLFP